MTRERMREIALRYFEDLGRRHKLPKKMKRELSTRLNAVADALCEPREVVQRVFRSIMGVSEETTSTIGREECGRIALAYYKYKLRTQGFEINDGMRRELGNVAKAIYVPFEEVLMCVRTLICELIMDHLTSVPRLMRRNDAERLERIFT